MKKQQKAAFADAGRFLKKTAEYGSCYRLDGIKNLMQRLGNVHEQLKIIHAAGTNGKGSVCALTAQILTAAGYRTGLYASPAVFSPREIIKIDGKQISPEDFAAVLLRVKQACSRMVEEGLPHPTEFEVETAAAFCFFTQENCDYAVIETGLGGALDATNLISRPVCSVFTSISRDHMALLGETLEEIASNKAGIIKPGCPCVTAVQEQPVMQVLEKAAAAAGSRLLRADSFMIRNYTYSALESSFETQALCSGENRTPTIRSRLTGACQKENFACVLAVVRLLTELGVKITPQAAAEGFAKACLPGRLEKIKEQPEFYIDGAHNEKAAWFLKETVRTCFSKRRIVYIIGVLADKEYDKVLRLMLPYAARVFTVTPDNPRALDAEVLARQAGQYHPAAVSAPDFRTAAALAEEAAGARGVVLAFGSFSFLGDLRQAVRDRI